MRLKRFLLVPLLIAITASWWSGCGNGPGGPPPIATVRKVVILQHVKHPIIDDVAGGCEDRLRELLGAQVDVVRKTAGSDPSAMRSESIDASAAEALLVPVGTPAAREAISAVAGKTPIIFTFVSNPAAIGYSGKGSLPSVTGLANDAGYDGTLEAMQAILPEAKAVGYLVSSESNAKFIFDQFNERASKRGLKLVASSVQSAADIPASARSLTGTVDCYLVGGDHILVNAIDALLGVARDFKKPVFAVDEASVKKGAIAASTINYRQFGRRTGEVVAFVLAGAKPDTLEVERYDDFELVINETAANSHGLTIPETIRRRSRVVQ